MDNIPRVLVFSHDQMLLETRQLILEAFFRVVGAGKIQEAETLIAKHKFDLIVLCHSLPRQESQRVLDLVDEQCPETKVLILTIPGSDPIHPVSNQDLMTESGPYYLLKKSADILGVDLKESIPALNLNLASQ
jgi:hypothetical protein